MDNTRPAYTSVQKTDVEQLLRVSQSDFSKFISYENEFFKIYQHVDYRLYKNYLLSYMKEINAPNDWVVYVQEKNVNIGVYAGSFNPFTTGHYSILQKAEKIFDKVIIAFGKNYEKNNKKFEIPDIIKNRQIEYYEGLMTSFLDVLGEVTLIRGLRNTFDFQSEMVFERCLNDELKEKNKELKSVSIFCDAEHEHISSSISRQYDLLGKSMYRL